MILVAIYVILALIFGGLALFLVTVTLSIIALALIWFGEEIGDYTGGFHRIGRPHITKKSPGALVSQFGWLLLVMPIVILLLKMTQKR